MRCHPVEGQGVEGRGVQRPVRDRKAGEPAGGQVDERVDGTVDPADQCGPATDGHRHAKQVPAEDAPVDERDLHGRTYTEQGDLVRLGRGDDAQPSVLAQFPAQGDALDSLPDGCDAPTQQRNPVVDGFERQDDDRQTELAEPGDPGADPLRSAGDEAVLTGAQVQAVAEVGGQVGEFRTAFDHLGAGDFDPLADSATGLEQQIAERRRGGGPRQVQGGEEHLQTARLALREGDSGLDEDGGVGGDRGQRDRAAEHQPGDEQSQGDLAEVLPELLTGTDR